MSPASIPPAGPRTPLLLTITALQHHGHGWAEYDGRRYLVPKVLPGEQVLATPLFKTDDGVMCRLEEVQQPSSQRIAPACPFFARCGGCQLQLLPAADATAVKARWFAEVLAPLLPQAAAVDSFVQAPDAAQLRYRNKAEYNAGHTTDGQVAFGYRQLHRSFDILPHDDCRLLPEMNASVQRALARIAAATQLQPYRQQRGSRDWAGDVEQVMLRVGADGRALVGIFTSSHVFAESAAEQALWRDSFVAEMGESLAGLLEVRQVRARGTPTVRAEQLLWGTDVITEEIAGLQLVVRLQSFQQVNRTMATALVQRMRSYVAATGVVQPVVLDLYAGSGLLGMALAGDAREVVGIELTPSCHTDALDNLARNEIGNYRHICGDAGPELDALLASGWRPDVAVVDPPRAGLGPRGMSALLASGAPHIIYIACEPASLAREGQQLLDAGYRLQRIGGLDLFPQTRHYECMALFSR